VCDNVASISKSNSDFRRLNAWYFIRIIRFLNFNIVYKHFEKSSLETWGLEA